MMNQNLETKKKHPCPFVGLKNDPATHMAFISSLNHCYCNASPPAPIKSSHQSVYCLSAAFTSCPVYLSEKKNQIQDNFKDHSNLNRHSVTFKILTVAVVSGGMVIILWMAGSVFLPVQGRLSSPSFVASKVVIATSTKLTEPTPLRFVESTVTPYVLMASVEPTNKNASPTSQKPVSPHILEVPIGSSQKYIIHRIVFGENLNLLAQKHNTSISAILKVNHELSTPIQIGTLLIIPIGIQETAGLPVLQPYQVTQKQITVKKLAEILSIDTASLMEINALKEGDVLNLGDWLLIPHGSE